MRGRTSNGKRTPTRWIPVPQEEASSPPGYDFLSAGQNTKDIQIHVQPQLEPACCPVCGAELGRYGTRTPSFRDLKQGERNCVLIVHRYQYMCKGRVRHFVGQPLPGIDTKHDMTVRLLQYIRNNPDLTNVKLAETVGVSDKTVAGIHLDHAGEIAKHQKAFEVYLALGFDEKRIDGVDYFVLVDLVTRTYITMIEGNDHETIRKELEQYAHRDRVGLIVIDMHNDYSDVARELFPNAFVIYDAFHVLDLLDECRESVRTDAWRLATGDAKAILHDRKHFWSRLNDPIALDGQQHDLFEKIPSIMEAHNTYKALLSFWHSARSPREASHLFDFWVEHIPIGVQQYFERFVKAIEQRRDEVFQYFSTGATAGPTEAINRNIQAELNKGRGYSYKGLAARMKVRDEVKRQRQIDALNGEGEMIDDILLQRAVQLSTDGSLARSEKMRNQLAAARTKDSEAASEAKKEDSSEGTRAAAVELKLPESLDMEASAEASPDNSTHNWRTGGSTALLYMPVIPGTLLPDRCRSCSVWDAETGMCTVSLSDCGVRSGHPPSEGQI